MGFFSSLFGTKTRSSSEQKKFRREALKNATRDSRGNIQDVYTGRYHKEKICILII